MIRENALSVYDPNDLRAKAAVGKDETNAEALKRVVDDHPVRRAARERERERSLRRNEEAEARRHRVG